MVNRVLIATLAAAMSCAVLPPQVAVAQTEAAPARDGARDFDWEIGVWTTRVRRLRGPLSGSTEWVEYEGTSVIRGILENQANLVELDVAGPAGRIRGLSLRLYEPETGQWTLNFANVADGLLTKPMIGSFKDGRGEFYGQDTMNGRAIMVRFLILDVTADSARFEQAFSADGGQTWEINWIADDTRRAP